MEILESLLAGLRTVCAGFTDARRSPDPDVDYSMADIGLSAFSLFFMQSESFLSHQRRLEQGHGTSNCHTLFGMKKIPTDNYSSDARPGLARSLAALLRSSHPMKENVKKKNFSPPSLGSAGAVVTYIQPTTSHS